MCKICLGSYLREDSSEILKVLFEGSFEECCNLVHKLYDDNVCVDTEIVYILDENNNYWYPKFDIKYNPNGIELGTEF